MAEVPCGGWLKRVFDLAIAISLVALLSPVLVATALLVRIKLGRPVLFRQRRPGWKGRPFELWKFRTMTDARDAGGDLLPDQLRLTPFGRMLRQTSLDELPELFNVLRGEMSLVGPRPLLMVYLERYTPWQARRHDARPGITGLAQVSGRNLLSWDERFALDAQYIGRWSLAQDIKILWLTAWKVLKREGITQLDRATADEFMGSSAQPPRVGKGV